MPALPAATPRKRFTTRVTTGPTGGSSLRGPQRPSGAAGADNQQRLATQKTSGARDSGSLAR
ncbi:hypothetical protein GCM10009548_65000 [Streptomyces malaysiensis subsp. malaysiensis]